MNAPKYREGQQIAIGTHHGQITRLRLWLLVVAVFAMLGMAAGAYGTWSAGRAAGNNCLRLHSIVRVGDEIIADRDPHGRPGASLRQYRADGLLTQAQFDREMKALQRRLARWESADCPAPPPDPQRTPKNP